MSADRLEIVRAWVERWAETGPVLERLRLEEHRNSRLSETLLSLSDVTDAALLANPPKPDSGIIEMQRLFAKFRNNETSS